MLKIDYLFVWCSQ